MRKKDRDIDINNDTLCAEYNALFRYALSLTKNESEAEDITQEAFIRAMNAKEKFSGNSSLYTWLCSIAKNLWLNSVKKQNRNTGADALDHMPDGSSDIEELTADHDSAMQVIRALHTLDEPYKEVFSLRVFGELGFKDIAGLFGKTESWARVTFHRAKTMMINILRKDETL